MSRTYDEITQGALPLAIHDARRCLADIEHGAPLTSPDDAQSILEDCADQLSDALAIARYRGAREAAIIQGRGTLKRVLAKLAEIEGN